jgi:hypothetical protein
MIAKLKLIKLVAGGLGALSLVGGIWWHGHTHGVRSCERAHQAAVEKVRQEQRRVADRLEEAQRENRQLRDRQVRTIYLEPDPTGCADAPALDSVLDSLRGGG